MSVGQVQEYGDRQWLKGLWLEEAPFPPAAGPAINTAASAVRRDLRWRRSLATRLSSASRDARREGIRALPRSPRALRADSHGVVYLAYQSFDLTLGSVQRPQTIADVGQTGQFDAVQGRFTINGVAGRSATSGCRLERMERYESLV